MSFANWHEATDAVATTTALLIDALRAGGPPRPRLSICGGSAAHAVARLAQRDPELWSRLRITWADERCVPFDHDDSNRGQLHRDGAGSWWRPPGLELPLYEDGENFDQVRARFEAAWREDFDGGLDVSLLGMGPDGHVASLFPGRDWPGGIVGEITDSPKPPPHRVTLSRETLASAPVTVLIAKGAEKKEAVQRLREQDPALPATGLPGLIVVTDPESNR